ncbi:MAG: FemAB family PEP-CTERM system-associated protein [Alteromonadaceae bacterium]|nr:FemAB family PEP-CTERM system-associated protein [Alteromonadaceae bacterium]
MIDIRTATELDQTSWDEYVNQHNEHTPYHLFAWQQAVTSAYKHISHYLVAEDISGNNKKIVGIFPLIIFSKPFGQANLCALPFCDIGGILANNEEIEQKLLNESKKVALQLNAKFIEIRSGDKSEKTTFQLDPKSSQKVSMLMPLPSDAETLFASFKSKLRSQIRKSEKNGLSYKLGSSESMIDDFYHVFSHNMRALGSPVHAKQWFISLLKHYQNNMIISIVYKDETPVGAGIVLIAGNKASIPWASTQAKYNRLSPNMMLYWSFLKHLSDNGIKTFDFGRSSYGEGTYKFKQQWGAQPVPLNWRILSVSSNTGNLKKKNQEIDNTEAKLTSSTNGKLRSLVEHIWRKLPLNITVFLGPKVRKYISL